MNDRERPLTSRGRRAARKMGKRLAGGDERPDLLVSSPARRALKTARILARKLRYSRRRIVVDPALYSHSAQGLLRMVRALDERHACVMLIGHNPQLTALAHVFCSRIAHMPTCAVARLRFDAGSWSKISRSRLLRAALDYPKRPRT